jgi:UDP-glucose 4-epimerase
MRYLVTGGAGFIGSNLVDCLIDQGHEVSVIDNESSEAHESFYWNSKANNHKYDICNYNAIRHIFTDVDVVFHMAAESRIQASIYNPLHTMMVNTIGTCNILQIAREAGIKRVVLSSTSAIYGANTPPLDEEMTRDCLNPYSTSKSASEDLCRMYTHLYDIETVVLRYFNVYGPRQPIRGQYAPVVGIFLRQKSEGRPMTIVGTGEQRRDFVHVSDVVRANLLAADLQNKDIVGESFNIGTGINYSVSELADMIGGEKSFIPPREGEIAVSLADNSKAKLLLSWKPQTCLKGWIKNENR